MVQTVLTAQIESDKNHYCNIAHAAERFFNPKLKNRVADQSYDLKYYRFEWEINPPINYIKGTASPYFTDERRLQ